MRLLRRLLIVAVGSTVGTGTWLAVGSAPPVGAITETFPAFPAGLRSFAVPAGVTSVTVTAVGGSGGDGIGAGPGGLGTQVTATVPVTPCETLNLSVGPAGGSAIGGGPSGAQRALPGFAGHGDGGPVGGGGGGAPTALMRGGTVLVSAGGGGGGGSDPASAGNGGGGSGPGAPFTIASGTGVNGSVGKAGIGDAGGPGTGTAGGAGGLGHAGGGNGNDGASVLGGNGGTAVNGGGGGGGGFFGGGGGGGRGPAGSGSGGGGGGGSSFVINGATGSSFSTAPAAGDGSLSLTFAPGLPCSGGVSTACGFVSVQTTAGGIEEVHPAPVPPSPHPPPGATFPCGLIGFTVPGLTPGDSVVITMFVPTSAVTSYYKFQNGSWRSVPAAISPGTFGGTQIQFVLRDGGPFDADGLANGTIVDPGGPAGLVAPPRFTG